MSADELRLEEPKYTERSWARTILLMILPLALVWAIAFWATGLLWWEAAVHDVEQVPPPAPPVIEQVDSSRVDLERYTRARPSWSP